MEPYYLGAGLILLSGFIGLITGSLVTALRQEAEEEEDWLITWSTEETRQ